ncbi:NASP-related protein sim3 [Rhizoctonia solani]|uniref:NASP-related protein sim3 n=1 Tax=Rhizoctonia solani TaxID=456999 RepID=A0A0K6GHZ4_9AGAM|nr:NASP-related protein sim3 [Rhizoctonia solani]
MSVEEVNAPKPETEPVAAASMTETETKLEIKKDEATVQEEVEIAKKAFALKDYEEAVQHYATALELARTEYGENTPSFADLLLSYGRALIENATSQNAVFPKEEGDPKESNGEGSSGNSKAQPENSRIHFGDGPSSDDEDGVGDETVDTTAGDLSAVKEEGEREEEHDDDEPEDDFNAAWDVLDLARAYYDKQEGEDMKLKLSEAYMSLGDVSLETEKFEQAILDYTSSLSIKTQLLPFYSRQVCEAHYRLALVLDLTQNKLSEGIRHMEQAISSLKARVTVIKDRLDSPPDTNGKGKGIAINDPIDTMDEAQLQAELKEVEELVNDLSIKHEDMKVTPEATNPVDEESGVKKVLDDWLKPSLPAAEVPPQMDGPVNDLSKLVKKKKKPAASAPQEEASGSGAAPSTVAAGKRKVETEGEDGSSPVEKKAKIAAE